MNQLQLSVLLFQFTALNYWPEKTKIWCKLVQKEALFHAISALFALIFAKNRLLCKFCITTQTF